MINTCVYIVIFIAFFLFLMLIPPMVYAFCVWEPININVSTWGVKERVGILAWGVFVTSACATAFKGEDDE